MDPKGSPRSFQKTGEVKAILLIAVNCVPFACADLCADAAHTAAGEAASRSWRWTPPTGTGLHHHRLPVKMEKSSFTNECLWRSTNSNFIKSWPFIISCVTKWAVWAIGHSCRLRSKTAVPGRALGNSSSTKLNELAAVSANQHFYLKEQLTDHNYSDLGMWQAFSQKWTK